MATAISEDAWKDVGMDGLGFEPTNVRDHQKSCLVEVAGAFTIFE